jgi:hypothetical protein
MINRDHNHGMPKPWLQVIGFIVVLWAAASDAMAQARDVLVTEVRGTVVRNAVKGVSPVRALDNLKAGDRVRLSSDSRLALFASSDALLYTVDGPAEVVVGPKGVTTNGKPASSIKVDEAYRNIKVNTAEMVQGSLVMRGANSVTLLSPDGAVNPSEARTFRWKSSGEPVLFELATDAGDLVHRAALSGDSLRLPEGIALNVGTKYVWGVRREGDAPARAEWTDFVVLERHPKMNDTASRSERVVYAAWLQHNHLSRAAARAFPGPETP